MVAGHGAAVDSYLKQDQSVVPALTTLAADVVEPARADPCAVDAGGARARPTPALVRSQLMHDPDEQIRIQAIRVSESLYKAGDTSFGADWKTMTARSARRCRHAGVDDAATPYECLAPRDVQDNVGERRARAKLVADAIVTPPPAPARETAASAMESIAPYSAEERAAIDRGRAIYGEICFSCHGDDGLARRLTVGQPTRRAPALAASPRVLGHKDYVINAMLYGLTGPSTASPTEVMIPMGQNSDEWVAAMRPTYGTRSAIARP